MTDHNAAGNKQTELGPPNLLDPSS